MTIRPNGLWCVPAPRPPRARAPIIGRVTQRSRRPPGLPAPALRPAPRWRWPAAAACAALLAAVAGCTSSPTTPPPTTASSPAASSPGTSPAASSPTVSSPATTAQAADWPTYDRTADRSGVSVSTPAPGPVRPSWTASVDGPVYAQPLVVGAEVIVATENDSVYALSASGGSVLWTRHLAAPVPSGLPCGNISPSGITGTPVADPATGQLWLVTFTAQPAYQHTLWDLDLATGRTVWQRSIDVSGSDPQAQQQRGALALLGSRVYVPLGGLYGDCSDYKGRVVGVLLDGTGSPVEFQPSVNRQGGIWNPAGPTVDAAGHMYVVSANGSTFPGAAYDHTNSVLEVSSSGKLLSSFVPADWAQNNEGDVGLGSQGVALVGTRWAVLGGKSGPVYVLRQGDLGGIGGQVSVTNVCLSFGGSTVDGDVVYLPCTDGVRAVRVDSAGQLHVLWHASGQIAGSPVVGGGRVWALDQYGGVLHALNPANGQSIEAVSVGVTSRFATPALYGSLVLVPTVAGVTFVQAS